VAFIYLLSNASICNDVCLEEVRVLMSSVSLFPQFSFENRCRTSTDVCFVFFCFLFLVLGFFGFVLSKLWKRNNKSSNECNFGWCYLFLGCSEQAARNSRKPFNGSGDDSESRIHSRSFPRILNNLMPNLMGNTGLKEIYDQWLSQCSRWNSALDTSETFYTNR